MSISVIRPHLSTAIFLISDLANDSDILQSSLFTRRSQNLVSPKLPSWGFWRYGQFIKWNRVKMAKNGLKMVELFLGASHVINKNILTFLVFQLFLFGYFLHLVFRAIFFKFGQNSGFVKYPKWKSLKTKNVKMVSFIICEAPPKKFNHF